MENGLNLLHNVILGKALNAKVKNNFVYLMTLLLQVIA